MNKIFKLFYILKKEGLINTLKVIRRKLWAKLFQGKKGLEIGGPSNFFKQGDVLPIYPEISSLDLVNFSATTIWEGNLKEGENSKFDKAQTSYQYIADAVDLSAIASENYDFVLSCHNLEHIANPFKAIKEWLRVLKLNGILLLVLPKKAGNFDHKRPVTTIEHLRDDYEQEIKEDDLSHLEEILEYHDLARDLPAGGFEQFKLRCLKNFENRAMHHHVFDAKLLKAIYHYFKLKILFVSDTELDYIIAGRKPRSIS